MMRRKRARAGTAADFRPFFSILDDKPPLPGSNPSHELFHHTIPFIGTPDFRCICFPEIIIILIMHCLNAQPVLPRWESTRPESSRSPGDVCDGGGGGIVETRRLSWWWRRRCGSKELFL
jgi:hypothetical protein